MRHSKLEDLCKMFKEFMDILTLIQENFIKFYQDNVA